MLQQEKKDFSVRHAQLSKAKRAFLEKRLRGELARSSEALTIPRRPRWGPVPLSPAQQGLWFLDQLVPGSPLYTIPAVLRITDLLNTKVLHQSLNALVQRHEVLRTTFVAEGGQPMQVIAPVLTVPLPVVDLSVLPAAEREAEALRLANEEVKRPFDLTQGPLMRVLLLKLGAEEYLLLLTMHHIISDGWSLGVLYKELAALYTACASGTPSPLPDLPIQYADFALWQQEQLPGEAHAKQLAYWKQQLAGAPAILDLPTDRPRPAAPTYRGSVHLVTLPPALTEALKALSRREDATLHMLLVAAFQTLLHRYTGQDDMVLGTIMAGRTQVELEALIGFFVNTLVLRIDLSNNPTFRELLERVRELTLEAHAHQEVPFDSLVRELQPTRALGQPPLFQVMLAFDPPLPTLSAGWGPSKMVVEKGTAKFDLSLELVDQPAGLVCRFEYSTDLFDAATIARMAGHWQTLLEGIVADPNQHLAKLPLLTEKEWQQVLVEWNATQTSYPQEKYVHQLFEAQVERSPDAVALVYKHERLTYRELNTRANQLAHYLRQLGVGAEVMVGVCMERSPELIVSLLAILKAGGVYVPLDPDYPPARLAFVLADTQMPLLLTQQRLLARLSERPARVVLVDSDWPVIGRQSQDNPLTAIRAEQLAYVIYTSGSTGSPKGVMIPQGAIARHCLAMARVYGLEEADRVLQFSTFTFDVSLEQILPTLVAGARLVLRGPEMWSSLQLLEQVKQQGLTVINLPPAYWQQVLREWAAAPQLLTGHQLRLVIVGGDRLQPAAFQLWRQLPLQEVRLLNAYGPTEATITATLCDLNQRHERSLERVSIGRPLPGRRIYILDRAGSPVPVGVAGELSIGGELLARGYLNQPELTAARFIADPFSQDPGARLYKTGDLARYLPDGRIEFLGRLDQQVKIRGFRIELGEVEEALKHYAAVREAVVEAREDGRGEAYLVGYVVAEGGVKLESQALRGYLQAKLPAYMQPAAFVQLESLPLLASGKPDRRALPVPTRTRLTGEDAFVAPRLLVHRQLVQIWEELLDVRPIGIRDNFFYLGGHSLLAARLVDRIEHVFGRRIALSTLFSGPTIEQLAAALQQQQQDVNARAALLAVQAAGSRRPFFFLHGDWTGGAFYCFTLAQALGSQQPFYALEPYRFGGLQTIPSLEAMAAAHIESMRAIQPQGPYLLGGFCNGGLLAYEMARQLGAAGERVDFLALINPSVPVQFKTMRVLSNMLERRLRLGAREQAHLFLRLRHALRHVYRRLRPSDMRVRDFDQLLDIDPRLDAMFPPLDALYNDYVGVFTWMVSRYETGIYPGKITFYWAREEPYIASTWSPVTEVKASADIESHVIPGTHMSCVTEHIQELTAALVSCVSRAAEEAAGSPLKHESLV